MTSKSIINIKSRSEICNKAKIIDRLRERDLLLLASGNILALRIPSFISKTEATNLAENLRKSPVKDYYEVNPSVAKVGVTLFDSNQRPLNRIDYHKNAIGNTKLIKKACGEMQSPIDKLIRTLSRCSKAGVCTETIDGKPMSVGICRICEIGSEIPVHHDILIEDAPYAKSPKELICQLSANIYVSTAEKGGELVLWDANYPFEKYGDKNSVGCHELDESLLLPPKVFIKPKIGELIIFNSTYAHAVRKIEKGRRVTMASFIGFRGINSPWSFWS